jgi:hypothetical protein
MTAMPNEESLGGKIGRTSGRLYKKSGLPTKLSEEAAGNIGCIVMFIAICVIWAIGSWVYSALDDAGYLSHTRETIITAEQSWIVGESKTCISVPLEPQEAHVLHRQRWDVTRSVGCDSGPEHEIKVTFHGRTERSEARAKFGVSWKCLRSSDSFDCYALD